MNTLSKSWNGKEELARVFWFYTLVPTIIAVTYADQAYFWNPFPRALTYTIILAWFVWVTRALWLCAFNAKWRIWGWLVRVSIILVIGVFMGELIFDIYP